MTTYLRHRQIRRADDTSDQENSAAISGAIPSSLTQEDYQRFFLSRLRQVIFGNVPGTHHWFDDFLAQGIFSLKDLTALAQAPIRTGFAFGDPRDGINRIFHTSPLKFIHDPLVSGKTIEVWHNGRRLMQTANAHPGAGDYTVAESGGVGTGFDTVVLLTFAPVGTSALVADFQIA